MFVKLEECRVDICCSTQISNADPHSQKIFVVDGILLEFGSLDWAAFKGKRSWLEGSWIGNEVLMAVTWILKLQLPFFIQLKTADDSSKLQLLTIA